MKIFISMLLMSGALAVMAQDASDLRALLLSQLHTTHDVKDWFVPINVALDGVTAEQAQWTDGSGNHSIGQLAYHLLFWNSEQLAKMKGVEGPGFSGNNDETFTAFSAEEWKQTVTRLDSVMKEIEAFVQTADEPTLQKFTSSLSHIATHNAYHVGQIIYVRKEHGIWNPDNGVK